MPKMKILGPPVATGEAVIPGRIRKQYIWIIAHRHQSSASQDYSCITDFNAHTDEGQSTKSLGTGELWFIFPLQEITNICVTNGYLLNKYNCYFLNKLSSLYKFSTKDLLFSVLLIA